MHPFSVTLNFAPKRSSDRTFFNYEHTFLIYSYFNLRCRIKASSVRDIHKLRQLQPHPLEIPIFLSSKWLSIGDLRCMEEALLILLIVLHYDPIFPFGLVM